jgi:hypothetical protein
MSPDDRNPRHPGQFALVKSKIAYLNTPSGAIKSDQNRSFAISLKRTEPFQSVSRYQNVPVHFRKSVPNRSNAFHSPGSSGVHFRKSGPNRSKAFHHAGPGCFAKAFQTIPKRSTAHRAVSTCVTAGLVDSR